MNREAITDRPKLLYAFVQELVTRHMSDGVTVVFREFERRMRGSLGTVGLAVFRHEGRRAERLLATGEALDWPEHLELGDDATWPASPKRTMVVEKVPALAACVSGAYLSAVGTVVPEGGPHSAWFLTTEDSPESLVDLAISTLHTVCRAALDERDRQSKVAAASEIQDCLLRQPVPSFSGFEVAVWCQPAEEIGGDFYDLRMMPDGSLSITVGDSTGHGLASALMARDVVAGVRLGRRAGLDRGSLTMHLNDLVAESSPVSRFVSTIIGDLTADGWFRYANAGHEPPLHVSSAGAALNAGGDMVLGVVDESRYESFCLFLAPGDLMVLYTDGITERRGAQEAFFGIDGMMAALQDRAGSTATEQLNAIANDAQEFGGKLRFSDDATLLVVRRLPV